MALKLKTAERMKSIKSMETFKTYDPGVYQEKLAEVRTKQANERTLLAYFRTALTLFVAGLGFIKFFDNIYIELAGWIFIPLGLINLILGIVRYRSTKDHIENHHI
jgi:putative membrane protein